MTDKLAAVACLADFDDAGGAFPERSEALAKFYEDAGGDPLVLNKWFGIQVRRRLSYQFLFCFLFFVENVLSGFSPSVLMAR